MALALLLVCTFAPGPRDRLPEPLRSLVGAERAFSAHSVEHGTRSAFLRFLGAEAVIFTPRPMNGRKFHQDQPEEQEPRSTLEWHPIFADVSASGDFGYTTGPYELSFTRNGEPAKSYGHYVTVWTKTGEGWKVAIDKGIRHPEPFRAEEEVDFPPDAGESPSAPVRLEEILELDRSYSFEDAASDSIRLYRDGVFPVLGKENVRRAIEKPQLSLFPEGGGVASSGDLAFTYGTAQSGSAEHAYLHIWKKEGGSFRMVLDNTTPLRPEVTPVQSYPEAFPREGATKILENESVVVWDVVWERGKATPMHEHRRDLVGVTLVEGNIKVVLPDGSSRELGPAELEEVSFGGKGIIHQEEGTSEVPRRAILIELKQAPKPPLEAAEGVPLAWPREGAQKVLENDRVVVWKYQFRPDREIPLHFHDKDTVVVELEPGVTRSVPRDGPPSETTWTGMTARFSPRGRIHREEVLSDAFRAVLVEVK